MKAPENRVFSIAAENAPVPGCTISELVSKVNDYYIMHFSLAAGTSISAETYQYPKLWIIADGAAEAYTENGTTALKAGDLYAVPQGVPVGVRAKKNCIYTEITLKKESSVKVSTGPAQGKEGTKTKPCQTRDFSGHKQYLVAS